MDECSSTAAQLCEASAQRNENRSYNVIHDRYEDPGDGALPHETSGSDQEPYDINDIPPPLEAGDDHHQSLTAMDIAISAYVRWWRMKDDFYLKVVRMLEQQYGCLQETDMDPRATLPERIRPAFIAVNAYRRLWETNDVFFSRVKYLAENAEKEPEPGRE